ncbi:hypothetical protein Tco_0766310 [Tanacetum coccineum]
MWQKQKAIIAWSYVTPVPSPSPNNCEESPPKPDYCTEFCGTEDSLCDTSIGKCICHPGIPTIPRHSVQRSLSWHCDDDELCKKQWCHREDSYCSSDGECICYPCGPSST